jgi:hypothetical protein
VRWATSGPGPLVRETLAGPGDEGTGGVITTCSGPPPLTTAGFANSSIIVFSILLSADQQKRILLFQMTHGLFQTVNV